MKQLLTLIAAASLALTVQAQDAFAIGNLFDLNKKHKSPHTTETIIAGKTLNGTGIDLYHSITNQGDAEMARRMTEAVTTDASGAVSREIKYIDGKVYFARLTMKPSGSKNRYILYLDNSLKGGDTVLLLYLEGTASLDEIKQLINITKNNQQK